MGLSTKLKRKKPEETKHAELVEKDKSLHKKHKEPVQVEEHFQPIYLYTVIVDHGQGDAVMKLLDSIGCVVQFTHIGRGTANRQILELLGTQDNRKDVIFAFFREDLIEDAKKELELFFRASKRNRGVGFTFKLASLVGEKMYHFLTNTL